LHVVWRDSWKQRVLLCSWTDNAATARHHRNFSHQPC
jgi:hypothetical protein